MVFKGGAFGRWLAHEGRALRNGISALKKEVLPALEVWSLNHMTEREVPAVPIASQTQFFRKLWIHLTLVISALSKGREVLQHMLEINKESKYF